MKIKQFLNLAVAAALTFGGVGSAQATIMLFEWGINIDGTSSLPFSGDPVPAAVDISLFDDITGLGSIAVTIGGVGAHTVDLYLDHEIDEATNTFFNEFGAVSGAPAVGQSWEIDEPGFAFPFGDIFDNFLASTLDNTNAVPLGSENDVAMAMGGDFTLGAGETATIEFFVSEIQPPSGFFLSHTDPDSNKTIYFSGDLNIDRDGPVPMPEPSMLYLLGIGLVGIAANRRRSRKPGRKTTER